MKEFWNIFTKGYWSESGIRIMVIVSLILQITLTLLGNLRKHSKNQWLRLFLWTAYLYADEVTIVTLGLLSREFVRCSDGEKKVTNQNYTITASWAPFLLLHLGGPDAMTAYSLEDNQLWQRHLLTLLTQLVVAGIVFRGAWTADTVYWQMVAMTAAVSVVGVIKCGERIWVQQSGDSVRFKNSMFPDPDPGPNFARYMDEFRSKRDEGYKVSSGRITEAPTVGDHIYSSPKNPNIPDAANLQDAYTFFSFCKQMFADLILSIHEIVNSQSYFKERAFVEVFKVVEVELGFIYDVLYTKAALIHSRTGGLLRVFTFVLLTSAFVSFKLHVDRETAEYSRADVAITYILLAGAVALELYSVLSLLSSDWAVLWLSKRRNRVLDYFFTAVALIPPSRHRRWSNTVGQHNLLESCLESTVVKHKKRGWWRILAKCKDQFGKDESNARVEEKLKEAIFQQLLKKPDSARRETRVRRARWNVESAELSEWCPTDIAWSIDEAELDESILLWHIATNLCDLVDSDAGAPSPAKSNSRLLSGYMMYLLIKRPAMLPNGIGEIRFQDTRAETVEFFEERKSITDLNKACESLLGVSTEIAPSEVKGDRSKSVLFDACRLADGLRSLEGNGRDGKKKKWEFICRVWVEMLSYAAGQCSTNQHARQLCEGGELLTHVWLLMAHLGITDRFQISKGHVRAKLIVQ